MSAAVILFGAAVPVSAASFDESKLLALGFKKTHEFTAGTAEVADVALPAPPDAASAESNPELSGGPKFSPDGSILDPVRKKITFLDNFSVPRPAKKREAALDAPAGFEPTAFYASGPGAEKKVALLFGAADGTYAYAGKLGPGAAALKITRADMLFVDKTLFTRIVYFDGETVVMVSSNGMFLAGARLTAGTAGGKTASDFKKIEGGMFGAAVCNGVVRNLAANGGAVNTLLSFGTDLSFKGGRMLYNGETGSVALVSALPDGGLIEGYCEMDGGVSFRRYLYVEPSGNAVDAFSLPAADFDQLLFDGEKILALAPDVKNPGRVAVYSCFAAEFMDKAPKAARDARELPGRSVEKIFEVRLGYPGGSVVCFDPETSNLLAFDGASFHRNGKKFAGPVPADFAGFVSASKGDLEQYYSAATGEFYFYDLKNRRVYAFRHGPAAIEKTADFTVPAVEKTPGALLSGLVADASGEVYLTDFSGFATYKFTRGGKPAGTFPNVAATAAGGFGELFMVSEGRSKSHKVLLEYDNYGNFMRLLGEVERPGESARAGAAYCLGKDGANRVYMLYFAGGLARVALFDYEKGVKTGEFSFDPAVLSVPGASSRDVRISKSGAIKIFVRTPVAGGMKLEAFRVVLMK